MNLTVTNLVDPISEAAPCGEDLSFSDEFDKIARMREADDPTLEQGEWITPLKVADWPGVVELTSQLLRKRSKDLRLAMWLTEAWAFTAGYAGLAAGLQVTEQLVQRYWPELHPLPDDGDQEERVGNLNWLLLRVQQQARQLPVVQGKAASYSLLEMAYIRTLAGREPDPAADPKLNLDRLTRAQRETSSQVWTDHLTTVRTCLTTLNELQERVDALLGMDGPSFVGAREALNEALYDIERLARDAGAWVDSGAVSAAAAEVALESAQQRELAPQVSTVGSKTASVSAGPIATRAEALSRLREVAEYFRRTEPHSPVAYLADKAVQWGNMPLHEWLRVVLKDAGSLAHVEELLGLTAGSSSDMQG